MEGNGMFKRRMVSLAIGLVCAGLVLSEIGHAGWAVQKAQAVASMASLELPALKKTISKRFVNAKLTEVLAWLSLEEFSFVADSSEFPTESTVTLNFRNQPLGAVLDAIADAYSGRWERRGEIFTLRPVALRGLNSGAPALFGRAVPATETPLALVPPQVSEPIAGTARPLTAPGALFTPTRRLEGIAQSAPGVAAPLAPLGADRIATARTFAPLIGQATTPSRSTTTAPGVAVPAPLLPSRVTTTVPGVPAPLARVVEPGVVSRLGETAVIQDEKAHQQAMKEVERALKLAEQEMKRMHESGEWKKAMERAMSEARAHQGDNRQAMEEARRAMEEARRAMQNMPRSEEWKKTWEKAREEIRKALKDGQVTENGKTRKMTDKERQALERSLKTFETIKMPEFKFMPMPLEKIKMEGLEKMKFEGLDKMKLDELRQMPKNWVMPDIDPKVFSIPRNFNGRVFVSPDDPEFKARNQEIHKKIEEMHKKMKEMGVEGGKGFTFVTPKADGKAFTFTTPKGESRVFTVPPMKMEELKELKGLQNLKPFALDSRRMKISDLLNSLSTAQKEKQEKQGFLTLSDLTPKQREMLGDIPGDGNWTFSYSVDGKKLTIKNK